MKSEENKYSVFIEFNDGLAKFIKVIEMRNGDIKITPLKEPYEWTIHHNVTLMKRLKPEEWLGLDPGKKNERPYIVKGDFVNFKGINWLFAPVYINGLRLCGEKPTRKDSIFKINKKSTERIQFFIGHCKTSNDVIEDNITRNGISSFILLPFNLQDLIIAIKE